MKEAGMVEVHPPADNEHAAVLAGGSDNLVMVAVAVDEYWTRTG